MMEKIMPDSDGFLVQQIKEIAERAQTWRPMSSYVFDQLVDNDVPWLASLALAQQERVKELVRALSEADDALHELSPIGMLGPEDDAREALDGWIASGTGNDA